MESKQATVNLAETELLNLLDGGVPAANLELSHLSYETLRARAQETNIRIAEFVMSTRRESETTERMERDVNSFYDEMQRRRAQQQRQERRQAAPGRVGRFVGRCLKLGRN